MILAGFSLIHFIIDTYYILTSSSPLKDAPSWNFRPDRPRKWHTKFWINQVVQNYLKFHSDPFLWVAENFWTHWFENCFCFFLIQVSITFSRMDHLAHLSIIVFREEKPIKVFNPWNKGYFPKLLINYWFFF